MASRRSRMCGRFQQNHQISELRDDDEWLTPTLLRFEFCVHFSGKLEWLEMGQKIVMRRTRRREKKLFQITQIKTFSCVLCSFISAQCLEQISWKNSRKIREAAENFFFSVLVSHPHLPLRGEKAVWRSRNWVQIASTNNESLLQFTLMQVHSHRVRECGDFVWKIHNFRLVNINFSKCQTLNRKPFSIRWKNFCAVSQFSRSCVSPLAQRVKQQRKCLANGRNIAEIVCQPSNTQKI